MEGKIGGKNWGLVGKNFKNNLQFLNLQNKSKTIKCWVKDTICKSDNFFIILEIAYKYDVRDIMAYIFQNPLYCVAEGKVHHNSLKVLQPAPDTPVTI